MKHRPLFPSAQLVPPTARDYHVKIRPSSGWTFPDLREAWEFRKLMLVFAKRELSLIYRQTLLGVAWIIVQPLVTITIFTILFGQIAKIPSNDIPYPLFALGGVLPWQYFAKAVTMGTGSLTANGGIISKIYFPRLLLPLSSLLPALVDLALGLGMLALMLAFYQHMPSANIIFAPLFLGLIVLTAMAVSILLSAINALYRDVMLMLPFALQIGMYLTPIIYPLSFVPERWQWLILLNPLTGPIEGVRWSLLGGPAPPAMALAYTVAVSALLLLLGGIVFGSLERKIVDRV